jgi:murein L,D-transpeptidase YafK
MNKRKTVAERLEQYGEAARKRLLPHFEAAGVPYPPARMTLVGLKSERRLELYAAGQGGPLRFIRSYPFTAASGGLGPKLRQGDNQVPEGLYRIELLNPNSLYHLSLRVNYPNAFDKARAAEEKRRDLGGDIMIHGNEVSIGCIAIGDEGIEEVFTAAAQTGIEKLSVIISPVDARVAPMPAAKKPAWLPGLYAQIAAELKKLPPPTARTAGNYP